MMLKIICQLFGLCLLICLLTSCGNDDCLIQNFQVEVGDCIDINTYTLKVDLLIDNADSDTFELFARNNVSLGKYSLTNLPLTLNDFKTSGLAEDYLKVCISGQEDCCMEIEFEAAACQSSCLIEGPFVEIIECNDSNGSYVLDLSLYSDDDNYDSFQIFVRNDVLIGSSYDLDNMPLRILDMLPSGLDYDYLKICLTESGVISNTNSDCCKEIEFMPPTCEGSCSITELTVNAGECNDQGEYQLDLNFTPDNAGNEYFDLYIRNNVLLGYYEIADLPLSIDNFVPSGNDEDYIKVCINDVPDCCQIIEFIPPDCNSICQVSDLTVQAGECTGDGIYELNLNFEYENPGNIYFDLFVRNGVIFNTYKLEDLPLLISEFPMSGLADDFIKICINDHPDCCQEVELISPECKSSCYLSKSVISVEPPCDDAGRYKFTLDFEYGNSDTEFYKIYLRNNVELGTYRLDALPLIINDFTPSGLDEDYIKVCIDDNPECCQELEFIPPDC